MLTRRAALFGAAGIAAAPLIATAAKAEVAMTPVAAPVDLSKLKRVVKLTGFVNSTLEFTEQPKVINGASDLLAEVFGETGIHARSAFGVGSLPNRIPVEIEAIIEIA